MRDRHTSPFEMVELKFHCAMPHSLSARQWIRHRTANVNEYSGRYSKMPNMFCTHSNYLTVCYQNRKNKQGRTETVDPITADRFVDNLIENRDCVTVNYDWAIEICDIARELARIDLPVSTYTQWYSNRLAQPSALLEAPTRSRSSIRDSSVRSRHGCHGPRARAHRVRALGELRAEFSDALARCSACAAIE